MRAIILAAVVVAMGGLTSCSTGHKQFLYVTGPGTNEVFQFQIHDNGTFTALNPASVSAGSNPVSVVLQPAGNFAYIANFSGNDVTLLSVNRGNGALGVPASTTPIPPPSPANVFATDVGPISMAIAPGGTFLFVLNQGSNDISGFAIDPTTGNLSVVNGSPFASGCSGSSLAITPKADTLFVTCPGLGTIEALTINGQGVLSAPTQVSGPSGSPTFAGVEPTGRFLYVADPTANGVFAFSIGSNGALTAISGSPFASGAQPIALAATPQGSLLYVANQGSNNVSAFVIDSKTGALGTVSGSPFSTGGQGPTFVAASAAFLYVGDQGTNDVAAFSIGSNGALTAVPNSPFNVATSPISIALIEE
jgi:6-phosphogluconolactonase